jgi:rhodanese-related sulfurtransferase
MQLRTIERSELQSVLSEKRPLVLLEALDEEYYRKAHLPGALPLPLKGLKQTAGTRLLDKNAELVVYCASSTCQNSDVAARALLELGYSNVRVYRGGKADWIDAGLPVEVGAEPTHFTRSRQSPAAQLAE